MGPAAGRQRWSRRQSSPRLRSRESFRRSNRWGTTVVDHPPVDPLLVGLGAMLPAPDEAIGLRVLPDHPLIGLFVGQALILEIEDVILPADRSADQIEIAVLVIAPGLPP